MDCFKYEQTAYCLFQNENERDNLIQNFKTYICQQYFHYFFYMFSVRSLICGIISNIHCFQGTGIIRGVMVFHKPI